MPTVDNDPVIAFESQRAFEAWLEKNHDQLDGLWLRIYKKASGTPTVTYAEALDVALCFGWIDGLKRSYDEESFIQRFTPRRAKSVWSKVNVGHVERLTRDGRMRPAGQAALDAARRDGRLAKAYDSPKNAKVPEDFLRALKRDKKAYAFFQTLSRVNHYAIAYRLQTAKKPETRERRMKQFLEMMARGEKIHR